MIEFGEAGERRADNKKDSEQEVSSGKSDWRYCPGTYISTLSLAARVGGGEVPKKKKDWVGAANKLTDLAILLSHSGLPHYNKDDCSSRNYSLREIAYFFLSQHSK